MRPVARSKLHNKLFFSSNESIILLIFQCFNREMDDDIVWMHAFITKTCGGEVLSNLLVLDKARNAQTAFEDTYILIL